MAAKLLIVIWWIAGIAIFLFGLIELLSPRLPQVVQDLLLYGKARGKRKEKTFLQPFEVPKKWFLHFYLLGFVMNGGLLMIIVRCYCFDHPLPNFIQQIVQALNDSKASTDIFLVMLVIGMMILQNVRRTYECLFVSVYSAGTMNLIHYSLGLYHYSAFAFAMLTEAPSIKHAKVSQWQESVFRPHVILGVLLFLYASRNHNKVHVAFADLRKDNKGKVVTQEHKIPRGGWFEYVSCPHYLFECVTYLSFIMVVGVYNQAALAAAGFVTLNQLTAALITHSWYKKQYKTYPKDRKAIIPYLL